MNILILSWRGPGHSNAGGAEQATLEHAKCWVEKGHKVWWFTSSFPGSKKEEKYGQVQIIRMGNQLLGVHLFAPFWYLLSKHPEFDIVIDQFHGIPFFAPLYVKAKKIAYIHEATKEVWLMNHLPFPLNFIFGISGRIVEPFIFKLVYKNIKFMTVSNSTKRDLMDFGINEKSVVVIHNGINFLKELRQKREKRKTLLYLGALAKDKGIEDALVLFDKLNLRNLDMQFWVVGRGEGKYLGHVKARKFIKYFGYVSERKKFELLSRAHILINPSAREGWGLVNIESGSVGTPVVGYNVPGMLDSVVNNKTGLLVDKGNIKALEFAALKVLGNESLFKKMSDHSIKWSKKFSWEKAGKESLKLIEKL